MFKTNLKHRGYEMGACSKMEEKDKKLNTSEKLNNKGTSMNVKEWDKKTASRHSEAERTLGKCTLPLSNEVDQYLEEQGLEDKQQLEKRREVAMFEVADSLRRAVYEGDLERAKELINSIGNSSFKKWSDGYMLLCQALINKNTAIAKLLLNYDCKVNNENEKLISLSTPLHLAVISGDFEVIKMILGKGADVNARDFYGKSPLHLAATSGCSQTVVECLLKFGADVNIRNDNGESPLHLAATSGCSQTVVECLLKFGADVNMRNNILEISGLRNHLTPLHLAALEGHPKIVECLLRSGADVNARDINDISPLQFAALFGHSQTAECLSRCGADVNARDINDISPLHFAALFGHTQTVECLLKSSADVNIRNIHGESPLHKAVLNVQLSRISGLGSYFCVQSRDKDDMTALHVVATLLKHGADVNIRNNNGESPLHLAVLDVQSSIMYHVRCTIMSEYGIYYYEKYRDKDDMTALHVVAALLKHGADINITNKYYQTAFDIAVIDIAVNDLALYLGYYVLKMIAANLYVTKRNKSLLVQVLSCSKWGQCKRELEQMKSEVIFCNISFYYIFIKGISLIELYTMNENSLKSLLKSANWEAKFPICKTIIASHFRKSIERKVLLELANRSLNFLFNRFAELPHECSEQILSYLNNETLNNLIDASEPHDNS